MRLEAQRLWVRAEAANSDPLCCLSLILAKYIAHKEKKSFHKKKDFNKKKKSPSPSNKQHKLKNQKVKRWEIIQYAWV